MSVRIDPKQLASVAEVHAEPPSRPAPKPARPTSDVFVSHQETQAQRAAVARVTPPLARPAAERPTVLVFGLSANPPTGAGGHAGIVRWGAETLRVRLPSHERDGRTTPREVGVDQVWVLPVYKHIFSSKRHLVDYEHRKAMAQLAFESLPGLAGRVHVKDTERDVVREAFARAEALGEPPESVQVGTIDVMRRLMADNPDKNFVLALGGDTYADLLTGKWKEGDTLRKLVPIVVIPRKGVAPVDGSASVGTSAPELTNISSTAVRSSSDLAFLRKALDPKVLDYMMAHKLYAFSEGENT